MWVYMYVQPVSPVNSILLFKFFCVYMCATSNRLQPVCTDN